MANNRKDYGKINNGLIPCQRKIYFGIGPWNNVHNIQNVNNVYNPNNDGTWRRLYIRPFNSKFISIDKNEKYNEHLILPCNHEYKSKRVREWIRNNNVCPKCEYIKKIDL